MPQIDDFALGKILYEARIREADLAMAQARAILKQFTVEPR